MDLSRFLARRTRSMPVPPDQVSPPPAGTDIRDPEQFIVMLRAIVNQAYAEMERMLPLLCVRFSERKVTEMYLALGDLRFHLTDMLALLYARVELGPPSEDRVFNRQEGKSK